MSRLHLLQQQFSRLTRIDKAFLIALLVQATYSLLDAATGFPLPGSGLVRLAFIIITILFMVRSFPRIVRRLLWRGGDPPVGSAGVLVVGSYVLVYSLG